MPEPGLTIYYNTLCPVCDAGIDGERDRLLDLVRSGRVDFRDINLEPDALARFGAGLDDIRKRLHAVDRHGEPVVGVDVVTALWRMGGGRRWLARLVGNPVVRPFARFAYDRFADVLYARNVRKGHWR